jgi:hypothetical protein
VPRSRSRPTCHAPSRRPTTGVPPPGLPLAGPEDALRVLLAVASDPPAPETVALLLDGAHRGLTCFVCEGAHRAPQVAELGTLLGRLTDQEPAVAAVVLATARPDGGIEPEADDERTFFSLQGALAERGVDLVDWFVLAGGLASSLAERFDACWRWHSASPW